MVIISRAKWGARFDRGFGPALTPAVEVWLHHSVTIAPTIEWLDADRDGVQDAEERAMRTLEDIGESRFGGGISYTFAVMPSGRIYEGHGVDREGAHTAGRNGISRSIVLVGNYETHRPTTAQLRAVAELLRHGHARGWWRQARINGGHQQAPGAQTACPGRHGMAAIPRINQLAAAPPAAPITEEDDMSVAYVKGNSPVPIPGTKYTYGDVVFLVEWDTDGTTRKRVVNSNDVGYRLWRALDRPIKEVDQALVDAIPDAPKES
jgi:hypothetical protein